MQKRFKSLKESIEIAKKISKGEMDAPPIPHKALSQMRPSLKRESKKKTLGKEKVGVISRIPLTICRNRNPNQEIVKKKSRDAKIP